MQKYTIWTPSEKVTFDDWDACERYLWLLEHTSWHDYALAVVTEGTGDNGNRIARN